MINTVIKLVQLARGDLALKEEVLEDGEIFWQYKNNDGTHTSSEGQLFIGQRGENIEVANRRSIDALRFKGYIGTLRDFSTVELIHTGDFWVADENVPKEDSRFGVDLLKEDILLITNANDSVIEWIRLSWREYHNVNSTLEVKTIDEAIGLLESRMLWCGTIHSREEFDELRPKHIGSTYFVEKQFSRDGVIYPIGSLVIWNGERFILAKNDYYTPNVEEIYSIETFTDIHKEVLAGAKSWTEAIHRLNVRKAELDATGHIPIAQLPESVVGTLKFRGFWYPLKSLEEDIGAPAITQTLADDSTNQDALPANPNVGDYYIVDFPQHLEDLQYLDQLQNRVFTFNQGDFVIYCDAEGDDKPARWEYINNASKIKAILFQLSSTGEVIKSTGTPKFSTSGKILLDFADNNCTIYGDRLVSQIVGEDGKHYAVPRYSAGLNELENSDIFNFLDKVKILNHLEVGTSDDSKNITAYGGVFIESTHDTAGNPIQHALTIKNFYPAGQNTYIERVSHLWSSTRNQFGDTARREQDIILPEASSTLAAILKNDALRKTFITKSLYDGYITSTLISEQFDREDIDYAAVFYGGRVLSKNVDTNKLKFFDFNDENDVKQDEAARYVELLMDPRFAENKTTAYLPGARNGEVHLATLEDLEDTWELAGKVYNVPRVLKHIRADGVESYILAISVIDSHTYGSTYEDESGQHVDNTTLEEIPAYKNGPFKFEEFLRARNKTDVLSDARDNRTTFDSWIHARRAISSEEGFALPSSAYDNDEVMYDGSKQNANRKFAAFIASRTKFKDSPAYRNFDDTLKEQDVEKIIEVPAESGVLMTDNSRIECGVILDDEDLSSAVQDIFISAYTRRR